ALSFAGSGKEKSSDLTHCGRICRSIGGRHEKAACCRVGRIGRPFPTPSQTGRPIEGGRPGWRASDVGEPEQRDGERLSRFERDALLERHCELFGIWPEQQEPPPRSPESVNQPSRLTSGRIDEVHRRRSISQQFKWLSCRVQMGQTTLNRSLGGSDRPAAARACQGTRPPTCPRPPGCSSLEFRP